MTAVDMHLRSQTDAAAAPPPGRERFYSLDGLRGIAALIVSFYHLQAASGWRLPHAFMVVDVFFVMSGFVLAHSHLAAARSGQLTLDRFLRLRVIRLYPTAFLGMLGAAGLMLVPMLIHHKRSLTAMLEYLAAGACGLVLLPFPVLVDSKVLFHLNIPIWSLFTELVMNCTLFLLLPRIAGAPGITLFTCALVWVAAAASGASAEVGPVWGIASLLGGLARTAYGLLLGGLLCVHRARFAAIGNSTLAGVAALLLLLVLSTAPSFSPAATGAFPWADFCYDFGAGLLAAPLIVALSLQTRRSLLSPAMLLLGRLSFPFFAFHVPILHALESLRIGERIGGPAGQGAATAMLTVLVAGALSLIAAMAYEPRAQAWLRARLLPGGNPPRSAA